MINSVASDRLSRLQLAILPGRPKFDFSQYGLYNGAYQFWLSYQKNLRSEVGLSVERISSDDFLRHDFINLLTHENAVVGMINSTLLNFASPVAANHSYVATYFGSDFVREIRNLGMTRMATLENIVADSEWRSSRIGLSLGAVVMGVALKKILEYGCDGAFGAARTDAPTAKISNDFGARSFRSGLSFHGKPTDLMVFVPAELRPHPSEMVTELVNRLWAERLDATLFA